MSNIKLYTPIAHLSLTDKLRNRLKMCGCHTFQQAMEVDYASWTNVAPKVVNAIKRFKDDHADIYAVLIKQAKEKERDDKQAKRIEQTEIEPISTEEGMSPEERRFYVANNILNAYISAGKLFGTNQAYKSHMAEIMKAADAFMEAYSCPPEPIATEDPSDAEKQQFLAEVDSAADEALKAIEAEKAAAPAQPEEKPAPKPKTRTRKPKATKQEAAAEPQAPTTEQPAPATEQPESIAAPAPKRRGRKPKSSPTPVDVNPSDLPI